MQLSTDRESLASWGYRRHSATLRVSKWATIWQGKIVKRRKKKGRRRTIGKSHDKKLGIGRLIAPIDGWPHLSLCKNEKEKGKRKRERERENFLDSDGWRMAKRSWFQLNCRPVRSIWAKTLLKTWDTYSAASRPRVRRRGESTCAQTHTHSLFFPNISSSSSSSVSHFLRLLVAKRRHCTRVKASTDAPDVDLPPPVDHQNRVKLDARKETNKQDEKVTGPRREL